MSDTTVQATGAGSNDNDERLRNMLALAAAIILGIAAVLTAWAAYRESLTSDGVLKGYAEQQALISEANDAYGQSDAQRSLEEQFFLTYAVQAATGNDAAVAYLEATMGEQLWNAVQWWVEQPEESTPLSPFVEENPYFADLPSQQLVVTGNDLMAQADVKRAEAETADQVSDRFGLANVFFAIVLFLAGVATLLGRVKVQVGVLALSVVMLIGGIVVLVTTPGWAALS